MQKEGPNTDARMARLRADRSGAALGGVDVARELDLRPDMLRRWKRQVEQDGDQAFPGQSEGGSGCSDTDDLL